MVSVAADMGGTSSVPCRSIPLSVLFLIQTDFCVIWNYLLQLSDKEL